MQIRIFQINEERDQEHLKFIGLKSTLGYLKGKSSLMIFDRHANLKYKYGSRNFWCRGYYADTVGKNEKAIREYIRNLLEEDYTKDQMTLEEYVDPFTGSKNDNALQSRAALAAALDCNALSNLPCPFRG